MYQHLPSLYKHPCPDKSLKMIPLKLGPAGWYFRFGWLHEELLAFGGICAFCAYFLPLLYLKWTSLVSWIMHRDVQLLQQRWFKGRLCGYMHIGCFCQFSKCFRAQFAFSKNIHFYKGKSHFCERGGSVFSCSNESINHKGAGLPDLPQTALQFRFSLK